MIESEIKFSPSATTQLKFTLIESGIDLLQKLRTLCRLLGVSLGEASEETITDEYYDDDQQNLRNRRAQLRRRCENTRRLVTLKAQNAGPLEVQILNRMENEFACSDLEFQQLLTDRTRIKHLFGELGLVLDTLGPPRKRLTIKNDRLTAELQTPAGKYKFCHDTFYYFTQHGYSEKFVEIEIELLGRGIPNDPQLASLHEALSEVLGYTPSNTTKLNRGLSWVRNRETDLQTVYSVGLDIVGFSKEPAHEQKQLILTLNYYVKKIVERDRGNKPVPIYLPTGDGMIMVFDKQPELIAPMVRELHVQVRRHNEGSGPRIEFRTGLHCGPVYKYSDVNENYNVAGNGINLVQRIMDLGEAWHVLASREAFEAIGNIHHAERVYWHPIGLYRVKHGLEIEVYNVFDEALFGNPVTPTKKM